MTSVTEKLRRLLDERGIKYETDERNAITEWSTYYDAFVFFARQREGKLLVETTVATEHSVILTPEQAIAATLGRGTCRNEWAEFGTFRCSECWMQVGSISTNTTAPQPIKFCPNCGREVVDA